MEYLPLNYEIIGTSSEVTSFESVHLLDEMRGTVWKAENPGASYVELSFKDQPLKSIYIGSLYGVDPESMPIDFTIDFDLSADGGQTIVTSEQFNGGYTQYRPNEILFIDKSVEYDTSYKYDALHVVQYTGAINYVKVTITPQYLGNPPATAYIKVGSVRLFSKSFTFDQDSRPVNPGSMGKTVLLHEFQLKDGRTVTETRGYVLSGTLEYSQVEAATYNALFEASTAPCFFDLPYYGYTYVTLSVSTPTVSVFDYENPENSKFTFTVSFMEMI